jgi:hypothetical protein
MSDDQGKYSRRVFNEVKDSGAREEFDTGSRRDTQEGKPRYSLVPTSPMFRLAMHYTNGAKKYGDHNWTLGQPAGRFLDSLERHVIAFKEGKTDEDHLAAIAWNAFALMHFEDRGWKAPDGTNLMDLVRDGVTAEQLIAMRNETHPMGTPIAKSDSNVGRNCTCDENSACSDCT